MNNINKNSLVSIGLASTILIFSVTMAYNASAKITRLERDVFFYGEMIEKQNSNAEKMLMKLQQLNDSVSRNSGILQEIKRRVK